MYEFILTALLFQLVTNNDEWYGETATEVKNKQYGQLVSVGNAEWQVLFFENLLLRYIFKITKTVL